MSIYEGTLPTNSLDANITAIKELFVSLASFTVVSDTGAGSSRVIILSKTGFTHNIKLYALDSSHALFGILNLAGTSLVANSLQNSGYSSSTRYRFVVFGNTIAFFVYSSNKYRCVYMCSKAGEVSIQTIRSGYWEQDSVYHNMAFYDSDSYSYLPAQGPSGPTLDMRYILFPQYHSASSTGSYSLPDPTENIFYFSNVSGITEGNLVMIDGYYFIVAALPNSSTPRGLIRYQ